MRSTLIKTLVATTLLAIAVYQFILSNYFGGAFCLLLAAAPIAERFFIRKSQSVTIEQSMRYFVGLTAVALILALAMSVAVFFSSGIDRLLAGVIGFTSWAMVGIGVFVAFKAKHRSKTA